MSHLESARGYRWPRAFLVIRAASWVREWTSSLRYTFPRWKSTVFGERTGSPRFPVSTTSGGSESHLEFLGS